MAGASWPSISADGTLAFVRPSAARPDLVWTDRAGVVTRVVTPPHSIDIVVERNRHIALSPDGTRVAVAMRIASVSDLWSYNLARNTITQMTHNAGLLFWPAWSPNGNSLVFSSSQREWSCLEPVRYGGHWRQPAPLDDVRPAAGRGRSGA